MVNAKSGVDGMPASTRRSAWTTDLLASRKSGSPLVGRNIEQRSISSPGIASACHRADRENSEKDGHDQDIQGILHLIGLATKEKKSAQKRNTRSVRGKNLQGGKTF